MLTSNDAHRLVEEHHRLIPVEAAIDQLLAEHALAGWPTPFVFPYDKFRDVPSKDLETLLDRYRLNGWRIENQGGDRVHSELSLVFEHPSKQFERGGPNDR